MAPTPIPFSASSWYWLADDGRVFSGAREMLVDASDPDYVAWQEIAQPTPWPRDAEGNQTDEALQDVLTPYNLWIDLYAYAANKRWLTENAGVTVTSVSAIPFASDFSSRNALANADEYIKQTPGSTVNWKLSDGSFIVLDANKVTKAVVALATYVQNCFNCENGLVSGLDGGSITTQQQIDDAFAAISNVFP